MREYDSFMDVWERVSALYMNNTKDLSQHRPKMPSGMGRFPGISGPVLFVCHGMQYNSVKSVCIHITYHILSAFH